MGATKSSPATSSASKALVDSKDVHIVIIGGAGTMGSSTALHLARRGYKNIQVLDYWEAPSNDSAGNDINKVSWVGLMTYYGY